jgi:hypothetical protein
MAVLVRCLGEPSIKVSKAVVGHRAHYLSLVKAVPRYPYRLRAVQQEKEPIALPPQSLPSRSGRRLPLPPGRRYHPSYFQ